MKVVIIQAQYFERLTSDLYSARHSLRGLGCAGSCVSGLSLPLEDSVGVLGSLISPTLNMPLLTTCSSKSVCVPTVTLVTGLSVRSNLFSEDLPGSVAGAGSMLRVCVLFVVGLRVKSVITIPLVTSFSILSSAALLFKEPGEKSRFRDDGGRNGQEPD